MLRPLGRIEVSKREYEPEDLGHELPVEIGDRQTKTKTALTSFTNKQI